jgi:hypothetical protein
MFVQSHPHHIQLCRDIEHEAEDALLWCFAGQYDVTIRQQSLKLPRLQFIWKLHRAF